MGLIDLASGASLWRGYDYFTSKRVLSHKKINDNTYSGKVGGNGADYDVEINLEHPRSSKCNCPHADGKRIICKHMAALYFAVFPKEADRFYNEALQAEQEEEERQDKLQGLLVEYVSRMKKSELQETLLQVLFDGPEWQYEHFLRDHIREYWE
ncbi:MAG: SWIM zinc finger family protein [Clostridia bacterium]|nr:SWIM zinc finger family protein [Clostridia bacterium]